MADLPLTAWLIGSRGSPRNPAPGIVADLLGWTEILLGLDATVHWLACDPVVADARDRSAPLVDQVTQHGVASAQAVKALLEKARQQRGPQFIWIGGHAKRDEGDPDEVFFVTEEKGESSLTRRTLWNRLNAIAAEATDPLLAVVDVCHCEAVAGFTPRTNLIAFAACGAEQKAWASADGGRLSVALRNACLAGGATVHAVEEAALEAIGGTQDVKLYVGTSDHKRRGFLGGVTTTLVTPGEPSALAAYLDWLPGQHARLLPMDGEKQGRLLQEVFVEVEVVRDRLDPNPDAGDGPRTLKALLESAPGGRWAVLGVPGAGKSTLARSLTRTLALERAGPVPVYVPLARILRPAVHPFLLMERGLAAACTPAEASGLADALRALGGRLWLLLDGLDEMGPLLEEAQRRIADFSKFLPQASIAVFSRQTGFQGLPGFTEARLQPLSPKNRENLLAAWTADDVDAKDLLARIEDIEPLRRIAGIPLLLTFIALTANRGDPLPATRGEVYRLALEHFLQRGRPNAPPIEAWEEARAVLRHLSLALQADLGTAWPKDRIVGVLKALQAGRLPRGVPQVFAGVHAFDHHTIGADLRCVAASPSTFLKRIANVTGIIADHDQSDGHRWRYLHKSLQDRLCAELLADAPEAARDALIEHLAKAKGGLERWAETFAQLCVLDPAPKALLESFAARSDQLLLRAAPEVDGVPPADLLALVVGAVGWHGEHLLPLAVRWRDDADGIAALLELAKGGDLETAARVHYALTTAEADFDDDAFFRAIGPARPTTCPLEEALVPIDAGSFRGERPAPVAVSAFELARTTVTRKQFRAFAPGHDCPGGDDHPVTEVSWYIARLFCIWAGGRLPTEAEWEYACRAGSEAAYCFGDDPEQLGDYAWFSAGKFGEFEPQPVRGKSPNGWGLYDMHGNVREWCADWYASDYPPEQHTDPTGAATGVYRVLRGGSAWNTADYCRSAFRDRNSPRNRLLYLGFRLARSPRPSRY